MAAAGGRFDNAGFVDDAREFVDEAAIGQFGGFVKIDKGEMGAAEEFGHVEDLGLFVFGAMVVVDFDGANGAEGFFVTEYEINTFAFDEMVGGIFVLGADAVIEQGGEFDVWNDVKFVAKEVNE